MYLYRGNVFKSFICEGFLDNGRKKFRKAIKVTLVLFILETTHKTFRYVHIW